MYVEFARNVLSVGEHRVERDEELGGYFLVCHTAHNAAHDVALALRKAVFRICFRIARGVFVGSLFGGQFQNLYGGHEEVVFEAAVRAQVGLAFEDVEKHHVEVLRRGGRGVVFDDDVFEFLQFLVHAEMAFLKTRYLETLRAMCSSRCPSCSS